MAHVKRNEPTKERANKWLNAQKNYTASVILVIEHMIEQLGYVYVMGYTKKFYNERLYLDEKNIQSTI